MILETDSDTKPETLKRLSFLKTCCSLLLFYQRLFKIALKLCTISRENLVLGGNQAEVGNCISDLYGYKFCLSTFSHFCSFTFIICFGCVELMFCVLDFLSRCL